MYKSSCIEPVFDFQGGKPCFKVVHSFLFNANVKQLFEVTVNVFSNRIKHLKYNVQFLGRDNQFSQVEEGCIPYVCIWKCTAAFFVFYQNSFA